MTLVLLILIPLLVAIATRQFCHHRSVNYKKRWLELSAIFDGDTTLQLPKQKKLSKPTWTLQEYTALATDVKGLKTGNATFFYARNRSNGRRVLLESSWAEPTWRSGNDRFLTMSETTLRHRKLAIKALAEMNNEPGSA